MTKINWYIFRLSPLNSNLCTLRELFDVDLRGPLSFRRPSSSFRSKNDHRSSFRRHTTKYTWIKFMHTNKLNFKIVKVFLKSSYQLKCMTCLPFISFEDIMAESNPREFSTIHFKTWPIFISKSIFPTFCGYPWMATPSSDHLNLVKISLFFGVQSTEKSSLAGTTRFLKGF